MRLIIQGQPVMLRTVSFWLARRGKPFSSFRLGDGCQHFGQFFSSLLAQRHCFSDVSYPARPCANRAVPACDTRRMPPRAVPVLATGRRVTARPRACFHRVRPVPTAPEKHVLPPGTSRHGGAHHGSSEASLAHCPDNANGVAGDAQSPVRLPIRLPFAPALRKRHGSTVSGMDREGINSIRSAE